LGLFGCAVELLKDLKDLAERAGTVEAVAARFAQLRERHSAKRTFIQRLDRAGFSKKGALSER
jgi:hypothetical protein